MVKQLTKINTKQIALLKQDKMVYLKKIILLFYFTRFHEWMCKSLPTTIATYFSIEMVKIIFYWSNNNSFLTAQSTLGCIHQLLSGRLKANRPPKQLSTRTQRKTKTIFVKMYENQKVLDRNVVTLALKSFNVLVLLIIIYFTLKL